MELGISFLLGREPAALFSHPPPNSVFSLSFSLANKIFLKSEKRNRCRTKKPFAPGPKGSLMVTRCAPHFCSTLLRVQEGRGVELGISRGQPGVFLDQDTQH